VSVEVFTNLARSTLSVAVTTNVQTTFTLVDASAFPTTGNFRVRIGTELCLCTSVAANVLTVTRGIEGTAASTYPIGQPVTEVVTAAVMRTLQKQLASVFTNAASAVYTCDSTGPVFDYKIFHNKSGAVTYLMPAPTVGRVIEITDITGAIETGGAGGGVQAGAAGNWIFIGPSAAEKFNTSAGYTLTGGATFNFTNGSPTVTATGSKFLSELAAGMTIQPSSQAGVSYVISSIASDTSLTLTANYTGTTSAVATALMNSLAYYANFGTLRLVSDGTDWFASSNKPLRAVFTASATFIPSPGCAFATGIGWGGGGGGAGSQQGSTGTSNSALGGAGGAGAPQTEFALAVTPNAAVTVTIGAGGNGGAAGGSVATAVKGAAGLASKFGATVTLPSGSGGASAGTTNIGGNATALTFGGLPWTLAIVTAANDTADNLYYTSQQGTILNSQARVLSNATTLATPGVGGAKNSGFAGQGGDSGQAPNATISAGGGGSPGYVTGLGNSAAGGGGGGGQLGTGTLSAGGCGGGGGGSGPNGAGGNGGGGGGGAGTTTGGNGGAAGTGGVSGTVGGNGNTTTGGNGGAGGSANANSGAGGGGAGAGGAGAAGGTAGTGAAGGNGGSGQITVELPM
jgi:hypothetical protein